MASVLSIRLYIGAEHLLLVVRQSSIEGYRRLSLIRASSTVKRQSTVVLWRLRRRSQARSSRARIVRLKRGPRTDARRELERAARAIPDRQARREALAQVGR